MADVSLVKTRSPETTGRGQRLEELYVRNAPSALRMAYFLTGDVDLVEDLVQEAFVRVAGRFGHLRTPDHTWPVGVSSEPAFSPDSSSIVYGVYDEEEKRREVRIVPTVGARACSCCAVGCCSSRLMARSFTTAARGQLGSAWRTPMEPMPGW